MWFVASLHLSAKYRKAEGETRDLAAASSNGSAPELAMMEGLQLSWKRRVGVEPRKMGIRLFCY